MSDDKKQLAKKANSELKQCLKNFSTENFAAFQVAFNQLLILSPKDACKTYVDVLKYVTPSIQAMDANIVNKNEDSDYKKRLKAMRDEAARKEQKVN